MLIMLALFGWLWYTFLIGNNSIVECLPNLITLINREEAWYNEE